MSITVRQPSQNSQYSKQSSTENIEIVKFPPTYILLVKTFFFQQLFKIYHPTKIN